MRRSICTVLPVAALTTSIISRFSAECHSAFCCCCGRHPLFASSVVCCRFQVRAASDGAVTRPATMQKHATRKLSINSVQSEAKTVLIWMIMLVLFSTYFGANDRDLYTMNYSGQDCGLNSKSLHYMGKRALLR